MWMWSSVLEFGFYIVVLFLFKQKTAYEVRISDWSSDVCSSDLHAPVCRPPECRHRQGGAEPARRGRRDRYCGIAARGNLGAARGAWREREIGSASCRERVCLNVYISVDVVFFKQTQN